MKRAQLRADFEKSFEYLDKKKMMYMTNPPKFAGYGDEITQSAWLAWVSSWETYASFYDRLEGNYDDPL